MTASHFWKEAIGYQTDKSIHTRRLVFEVTILDGVLLTLQLFVFQTCISFHNETKIQLSDGEGKEHTRNLQLNAQDRH